MSLRFRRWQTTGIDDDSYGGQNAPRRHNYYSRRSIVTGIGRYAVHAQCLSAAKHRVETMQKHRRVLNNGRDAEGRITNLHRKPKTIERLRAVRYEESTKIVEKSICQPSGGTLKLRWNIFKTRPSTAVLKWPEFLSSINFWNDRFPIENSNLTRLDTNSFIIILAPTPQKPTRKCIKYYDFSRTIILYSSGGNVNITESHNYRTNRTCCMFSEFLLVG